MDYKELSKTLKRSAINNLDIAKQNIMNMYDSDVIKLAFNIPENSTCCVECKYCAGKELKIPYCNLLHRNVSLIDFCSFGDKEERQ